MLAAVTGVDTAAAGSALFLLTLARYDDATARAVRGTAAAAAVLAAACTALRIPLRASFLAGAVDPTLVAMVAESPLGTSLWVRLAGLVLLGFALLDRPAARAVAGVGALLVCASFAFRGHVLSERRHAPSPVHPARGARRRRDPRGDRHPHDDRFPGHGGGGQRRAAREATPPGAARMTGAR